MNAMRRDEAPTLAALLDALTRAGSVPHDPLSDALRALRSQSLTAPLDLNATGALRTGVLGAIRRELGDQVGDMVLSSLGDKPLTRRSVEQILHAAVNLAAARNVALTSAVLEPVPLEEPPRAHAAKINGSNGQHAGGNATRLNGSMNNHRESAVAPQAAGDLDAVLQPLLEGRHEALLKHCLALVRSGSFGVADAGDVGTAATRLHDRVRAFLDRQGHWPIDDPEDYERHAKPAAVVMAAWDVPVTLDEP